MKPKILLIFFITLIFIQSNLMVEAGRGGRTSILAGSSGGTVWDYFNSRGFYGRPKSSYNGAESSGSHGK